MSIVIDNPFVQVFEGDALMTLRTLEADSVDCCVTSPPYWGLRDYGHAQQMGLEPSPFEYIDKMACVFDEVRRVLKPKGTCWVVIGDTYAGSWGSQSHNAANTSAMASTQVLAQPNRSPQRSRKHIGIIKPKDLCGIPWRLAFALQERGWYLRQDIIWAKPACMPESVLDRCTRSHEYVFMLTKQARYFYDATAIAELSISDHPSGNGYYRPQRIKYSNGNAAPWEMTDYRNKRDVWAIATEPFADAHFATFPTKLVELCIKAGCPADGVVLDPFGGCGTTGEVAVKLGRRAVLIELNGTYVEMIRKNLGLFAMAAG